MGIMSVPGLNRTGHFYWILSEKYENVFRCIKNYINVVLLAKVTARGMVCKYLYGRQLGVTCGFFQFGTDIALLLSKLYFSSSLDLLTK
jgi:hypothetical protein